MLGSAPNVKSTFPSIPTTRFLTTLIIEILRRLQIILGEQQGNSKNEFMNILIISMLGIWRNLVLSISVNLATKFITF